MTSKITNIDKPIEIIGKTLLLDFESFDDGDGGVGDGGVGDGDGGGDGGLLQCSRHEFLLLKSSGLSVSIQEPSTQL